jgi:hypothetical protein
MNYTQASGEQATSTSVSKLKIPFAFASLKAAF